MAQEDLVVCLSFPPFHDEKYLERLRALPGVEPVILPIDPAADWGGVDAGLPYPEPPPWAVAVAAERRSVLDRTHVLVALHSTVNLQVEAPQLRWIQGIGAGMEQFAKSGVRRGRVIVTNASGVSSDSMAEWVLGRLLQVWKLFREGDVHQRDHAYIRTYGRTFKGSTIGIVGLGAIGRAVAKRVRALGCEVLATRRSAKPGDASADADELFSTDRLHEMLARCDAVVVSAPETPDTYHLIDAAALAAMPSRAVLINVARGSLVDEGALVDALRSGGIASAALDVFDPEPLSAESPLWDLPGVYLSAHSSVSVDRYTDDVFDLVFENVSRYLAEAPLHNLVDMDALGFD